ncbi:MAG: hypothetical protein PVJ05_09560 [Candidatus Thorarchaeota archaeon]
MTEQARLSIELRSNLGYALMLQVTSAILIIGGTWFFGAPSSDVIWLTVTGILYGLGFIQLLVTRYVMQRERNGILVAFTIATFTYMFSIGMAFFWYVLFSQLIPMVLYSITFGINVILVVLLMKIPKS